MKYTSVLEMVGNTPVVEFISNRHPVVRSYIKLEGSNPSGSIKDRAALALIRDKMERDELYEGKTILDASSGSFACSVSMFGAIMGYPVKVVTGYKMTNDKINFIKYFGGDLISHGNFTVEGNEYCRDVLVKEDPEKYCFLDQLHNWVNPDAHYLTTGPEIIRDLPSVKAIVFSLGSGGTLNGVSRFVKAANKDISIIAVTASAGVKIPGTGAFIDGDYVTPFIQQSFDDEVFDYIAEVSYKSAVDGMRYLSKQGFYVGIQTGAVYQGMLDAVDALGIKGDVLMISGDAAWKNMDKIINI